MYPPPQQFTPVYTLPIHHQQHHTLVDLQQQSISPQPFISSSVTQQSQAKFPQLDSGLVVPTFQQREDLIVCINKAMAFLSAVASRGIATTSRGNYVASQPRVVKSHNCQEEGHMKLMLVEAQEAGQILYEEKLAFIADHGIEEAPVTQQTNVGLNVIDDDNLDPEGEIHLVKRLLYDNSSPRPLEEFNSKNPTKSFSPSPIPIEDSDSLMQEIDIFLDGDGSIPPGIKSDDYDSEDDDNSTSHPEFESFHVDYPNSGDSTIDVVEDIPMDVPNILPTHPALLIDFDFIPSLNDLGSDLDVSSPSGDSNKIYDPGICMEVESTRFLASLSPVINTLLPFSSENEDKVFNHGVLASKEKSPSSSSHQGLKASKLFHQKSPMLIHEDNTPNLGVRHPHFYPP
ncbi:hypothetical protein Tco_1149920 [Tanacetum coccineum]